ncbi:MAG: hypothetical protein AAFQ37_07760, partial [Bacteroidota bacterium]
DLYIVDEKGEIVASDTEDDGTPIPDFIAEYSGRYSVRMQLVAGEQSTSFVSLAILTEGGTTLTDESFNAISTDFYDRGEELNLLSASGTRWHDVDNQWCLFGLLLEEGESWQLSNMRLGSLKHRYYLMTDEEKMAKIDLQLNSDQGELMSLQEENGLSFSHSAQDNVRYELAVKNGNGKKGRHLILVGVVTEDF